MKDASTFVTTETKNTSSSTSVITVDIEIQVQMADSTLPVTDEGKTSSSASEVYSEAKCKPPLFDEIFQKLPYDEKTEIILFDKVLQDRKLYSIMVSFITAPKWKVVIYLPANQKTFLDLKFSRNLRNFKKICRKPRKSFLKNRICYK